MSDELKILECVASIIEFYADQLIDATLELFIKDVEDALTRNSTTDNELIVGNILHTALINVQKNRMTAQNDSYQE